MLAGWVAEHRMTLAEAERVIEDLTVSLPTKAYKL